MRENTPTLRERVWNLLGTARTLGRTGVTVALLAATLGTTPAPALAKGILRANTAYAGGDYEQQPDDRSVVVLKIPATK